MIRIGERITLDEDELLFTPARASGPGGQNVNKVSTAMQLRFDVRGSSSLPDDVRARLVPLAGRRMTKDGVLVIFAERFRSQERNREDAIARLVALIAEAATPPTRRKPTRPSYGERLRRLDDKAHRSTVKRQRREPLE